jgi:histidinol-phosphate aminotransferase
LNAPALPLRPELAGLVAYGAPQVDAPVRLNTNENPYPPPAELVADLARSVVEAASGLNRYPDREALALRAGLAGYLGGGLDPAGVWPANGSNEILQQLMLAFGGAGRRALGFEPSYTMHRLIAAATGTGWLAVPRRGDFGLDLAQSVVEITRQAPEVVFVCSPNNPTGAAAELDEIRAIYRAAPGMVVVDEAYAEFSTRPSALQLLTGRPRLVVTRTMSKAFALAGARVGYLVADPAVTDALRRVRLPYHLSAITQAAASAALRHAPATLATVARLRADRERMATQLAAAGYRVAPSDANFLLVGGFADSAAAWQDLLDRGILVRDVGLTGWLRITVGRPAEVDAVVEALVELRGGR